MIEQRPASQAFGELADELLAAGAGFRFQAKGRSMWPQIDDGEVLHVQQANAGRLKVGDIVLFRRGESREFKAHRIIRKQKDQFTTRGDASSEADGAIRGTQIVGKIIAKECGRSGRTVVLAGLRARCSFRVREMRRAAQTMRRALAASFVFLLLLLAAPLVVHAQVALDASTSISQQVTQAANTVTLAHTTTGANRVLVVGVSMNISAQSAFTLSSVALHAGATTVYTGTITGGAANAYVGLTFVVTGFSIAANNGTFTCSASTATTLTLSNGAGAFQNHAGTASTPSFQSVTGVTYNGVALTSAGAHNDSTNVRRVEMWYLVAPALGTNNVVVMESIVTGGTIGTVVGATTFTGVDQTSPIRSFATNDSAGSSDSANVTVTSGPNDMVLDTLAIDGTHTVSAPSGTQVQQWALTSGGAGTDVYGYGSTHGGAASVPMGELLSAAIIWSDAALSLQPLQTDLSVSVSGTSALFPTNLSYTIMVTNNGPAAVPSSGSVPGTSVTLTDTLAAGLTWVSSTSSQGSCSGTTTITCNLVTNTTGIAVGGSVTITVVVIPGAPGGYPNNASVTSSTPDLVNANNSATGVAYSDFAACATSTATAGGTLTGTINTYYPGTATANAGATSITLGTATGAATTIANGDLVLVIQMQDAAINSTNTSSYGDGISGSGSTTLNNAGAYEYATATGAVPLAGGTLTFTAAGPGGGLLYTYTSAAATATQGARTFQVVRVPNYSTATLGAALTGSAWNGSTGGILALNLSGVLTLNTATVHMDGLGFRGGAGMNLTGSLANLTQVANAVTGTTVYTGTISGGAANALAGTTFIVAGFTNAANNGTFIAAASTATTLTLANAAGIAETHAGTASMSPGATNSDFAFPAPNSYAGFGTPRIGADGSKGEGIAGTPHWVESANTFLNTAQTIAEGYPNGSMARGAPGNAGGGGTDGDPVVTPAPGGNDENAGGGGGANGGTGGQGGDTWNSNLTTGGFGGTAFPVSINRVVLGGGGGAGSSNNNSSNLTSSAAAGGGIVMIRAGNLTGTATITANGAAATNTTPNDAGGGGGAGGSIIILTGTGGEQNLTLQALGGRGGDAWDTQAYSNGNRHGPGGGGGGGAILTSSVTGTPTISVTGGANGVTLKTPSVSYGATSGTAGLSVTNLTLTSSPGQHSATICTDMAITKTGAPQPVLQNASLTYTVKVTNNGPQTATGVVVVDTLPAQVTYVSAVATGTGSCSQSVGVVTCNYATMISGDVETITIVATAATPSLALNTAVVNSATPDPTLANNTATFTSTIEYPNAVKLNSFAAGQSGAAVLISWRSGGELHNLGYNVYRESAGTRVLLNPSLIAGSALSMRETVEQHGAKSYGWVDRSPVNGALYWLEDVDLNGTRTLYGPISVESGTAATKIVVRSAMLSELAQPAASSRRADGAQSRIREAVVTPVVTKAALNTGFQLAAQPAVKIFVDHEGWYRITQPQLVAAGLNPNVQAPLLHLFAEGVEQPLRITGTASTFGPQAAIEFYGTAIDTPYSGQRVYWLMSNSQPGLRIPGPTGAGSPGPQPQSFVQTLELKPRTTYFAVLLTDNTDNFFGPLVSPVAAVQTLNVSNLASGGASIKVVLQGVTQGQQHDVIVALNGTVLGNVSFVGQMQGTGKFTIPGGSLTNGANTISLTSQLGSNDLSFIDHIDVSFLQTFTAQSDLLKFTAPAGDSVTVNGFKQTPTRLIDITNPVQPFAVAYTMSPQGGGYALQMSVPWTSSGQHTLLALADDQLAVPVSLTQHQPSTLHQVQAGAGVVILTAPQFAAQIQPLAALHQVEGRPVAMVSVDQIYDEFNFGERTPYAIKSFLQTATTAWTNKPHYLLLGGDASVDPRDYLGFGFFDFVPTKIVVTSELKTASDDWFSDFSNTGYAQIATGRLPARTTSDAQTMVGKILSYANGQAASWTNDTMLVADTDDPSVSFSQASLAVQKLLPPTMNVSDVFAGALGTGAARQDIISGINSGQLLVNYNGHGSVQVWGGGLFDDTAAASLTNGNRLPVFVMMNCLNGFFHDVYTQSLASSLLLSQNGGAVAVWASSGLTAPDPQFQMDQALVKTLFARPSIAFGDAIQIAKAGIADADVRKTFILFGDPLMRLKQSGIAASVHVVKTLATSDAQETSK
jgi:uncharacterized repeat protein (TIGR01451 family)